MKAFIVSVAIVSVVISPGGPVLGGLRAAANPAQQMTSARAAQSTPADGGWPRAYSTSSGATLVLYEPQVESWPEQKHMVLYAAVSHLASGAQPRVLATIRVEADTKVSVSERLVDFSEFEITATNFPTLNREEMAVVVSDITSSIPRDDRVIGLDRYFFGEELLGETLQHPAFSLLRKDIRSVEERDNVEDHQHRHEPRGSLPDSRLQNRRIQHLLRGCLGKGHRKLLIER